MNRTASASPLVHLVESDVRVREPLKRLLTGRDWRVRTYPSLPLLLKRSGPDATGCILLGRCDSDPEGWSLPTAMAGSDTGLPVVLLATHGSVSWMSRAEASTAAGELVNRVGYRERLLERMRRAIARDAASRGGRSAEGGATRVPVSVALTPREIEVSGLLEAGLTNKQAGWVIGISHLTVDVHRANIATKRAAGLSGDDPR